MNALEEKKIYLLLSMINLFRFSMGVFFFSVLLLQPVEWLCSGLGSSFNANDSNLIQYLVYSNRILKMSLIVSGAIALLVSTFLFFQTEFKNSFE